ncbi:glucosamine inositolphosphorylceramide transferase family protein [Roseiflexus sp.]
MMSALLASVRNALPFLRRIRRKDDWAIGLYSGSSPLTLAPMPDVRNPVLTAAHVRDVPALFVADPFLVRTEDRWLLFFEVLHATLRRGQIGLATSRNGKDWEYCQIVLREPFHLSYPHVFAWDGSFYMTPETAACRQVRLYRAVEFPLRWTHVATLLEGDEYLDPTPFVYQGRWWMFVGTGVKDNGALRLYHATTPSGTWKEHPCSPIVQHDPRSARPAGRVVRDGERLVRFAQDCSQHYGQRVLAFEITELTPERYAERPYGAASVLAPQRAGWNARGMHTLDLHHMQNGNWLALVDGYRKRFYVRHS